MIPVSQPMRARHTRTYLEECARTLWFSFHGPYVKKFEHAFASYIGTTYAHAVTSGTTALHVALAALNIGKGDEVIVPTFTMFSPVAAILYTGATPIFIDADPYTWTMDTTQIEKRITRHTKAILAVHIYGHPVNMDPLKAIAKKHHLFLIEDAAEGLGANYKGKNVGALSDIACFSFYANKLVTSGEGGMVVTNNARLHERVTRLSDMAYDTHTRFLHTELAFTYRMSNMQAAVGLAYLEEIEKTIRKKRHIAAVYNALLSDNQYLTVHAAQSWATPVWWMYGIILSKHSPISREHLIAKLRESGIETRIFFIPCHQQPAIGELRKRTHGQFPVADMISRYGLYLPSGPDLHDRDIHMVCNTIRTMYANV